MIIEENLENGIVRRYSNSGVKIHGGFPEGDYDIVYDPEDIVREYIETNIPIDGEKIRSISKVKLYHKLKDFEIWQQFKGWMETEDLLEDWMYSNDIPPGSELKQSIMDGLSAVFELTQEQLEDVSTNCVVD